MERNPPHSLLKLSPFFPGITLHDFANQLISAMSATEVKPRLGETVGARAAGTLPLAARSLKSNTYDRNGWKSDYRPLRNPFTRAGSGAFTCSLLWVGFRAMRSS